MGTGSFEVSLLLSQVHPLTCGLKSTEVSTSYLVIKGGKKKQWDLIAHGYNLSTWDPKAGESRVQGQPGLGKDSLGQ